MHRIDHATATAEDKFTEGNPTTGVPATVVTADWLNAVQEELITLLTGNGVNPDKEKNDQLKTLLANLMSAKAGKNGSAAELFSVKAPTADDHAMNWKMAKAFGTRVKQITATDDVGPSYDEVISWADGNNVRGVTNGTFDYLVEFSGLVLNPSTVDELSVDLQVNGVSVVQGVEHFLPTEANLWQPVVLRFLANNAADLAIAVNMRSEPTGATQVKNRVLSITPIIDADGVNAA